MKNKCRRLYVVLVMVAFVASACSGDDGFQGRASFSCGSFDFAPARVNVEKCTVLCLRDFGAIEPFAPAALTATAEDFFSFPTTTSPSTTPVTMGTSIELMGPFLTVDDVAGSGEVEALTFVREFVGRRGKMYTRNLIESLPVTYLSRRLRPPTALSATTLHYQALAAPKTATAEANAFQEALELAGFKTGFEPEQSQTPISDETGSLPVSAAVVQVIRCPYLNAITSALSERLYSNYVIRTSDDPVRAYTWQPQARR